ncbi:hypothetical protein Poly41_70800 [Novipirellula artificiosorum]|uniref:Uncharacterized protein n=1 Tax=Novipirellula artificiosorum TaxID=2528016 RepID=A0A5C6CK74_9BACT|nr:hypothetical protein Poly41_70800 [Novipirellula artificiosorum]
MSFVFRVSSSSQHPDTAEPGKEKGQEKSDVRCQMSAHCSLLTAHCLYRLRALIAFCFPECEKLICLPWSAAFLVDKWGAMVVPSFEVL